MKFRKNILLILVITLLFSCNRKHKQIDNWNTRIAEFKSNTTKSFEIIKSDTLIGKFYVTNFNNYLKSGFKLRSKKPKDYFIFFSFEFKNNGDVIFKDLTEFYGCGNGILSINKGNWKSKGNGIYELTFDGEYALETKFHTISEYKLIDTKSGDLEMKLINVIEDKKKPLWE